MGMQLGYTMMTEQAGPKDLVGHVVGAEAAGFDFAVSIDLMTYVTCPIIRYRPAVVAQQAATLQLLSDGRFTLGLGSGENLNEHVIGEGWPPVAVRQEMFAEAVQVIKELLAGDGYTTFHGDYYDVDGGKIWDLPEGGVPIGIAVSGPRSVELAARYADVLIATEPKPEL